MLVVPPEDVMERNEAKRFIWLLVSEVVPLVSTEDDSPANLTRNIERWCDSGILAPYAWKASRAQILALLNAGRIHGLPHKKRGLYLIHRDGLAHVDDRPKKGWPKGKKRSPIGKQTGAGAPERVHL